MHVYLAVGHGRRDNGTVDPGAVAGSWSEVKAGEHIVGEAVTVLRRAGVQVTHEAAAGPNFTGTVREANRLKVDRLVEVHHDWSGAPEGAFVHWWPGSTVGKELADDVLAGIRDAGYRIRSSWHKPRTDLYLLRHSAMPAALVEVGRIGQHDLDTPAELRAMGRAVAAGIARHAGVKLTDNAGGPTVPTTPGPYKDVDGNHPHVDGIAEAERLGLMGGYPDGTFRPDETPTRAQLATVLVRAAKLLER